MTVVPRHVQIHERKRGSVGFEPAGGYCRYCARDGAGGKPPVSSRESWRREPLARAVVFDRGESRARVGFRRGDPSVGIHIPYGAALAPHDLDATFARAREVLSAMWRVNQRRLATCQSWLLDAQLTDFLDPASNIVQFQRRFNLLDDWYDNDEETIGFIFQKSGSVGGSTTRHVVAARCPRPARARGHWRARPAGWISTATNGVAATDSRGVDDGRNSRQGQWHPCTAWPSSYDWSR